MKIGLVMTVKNEERLLCQNIFYHKAIGVDSIFVYFDNTTDNGFNLIKDIQGVITKKSVLPDKYIGIPELKKFWGNADEHHTARQCLNTYDALQQCRVCNIDWLISIDADELLLTDLKGKINIKDFFANCFENNIDIVQLVPLEVIARKFNYNLVMAEETYFKTKKNFKSKLDQIYKKVYNPYTNKYITTSYWLGHTMGKAAINVKSNIIPYNVHRYSLVDPHRKIKKIQKGFLLHYHLYDFKDFKKNYEKFKDHPPYFLSGNTIEKLKSLYINLVNDSVYNEEDLEKYYKNNLQFTPKKIKKLNKTRLFNLFPRKEKAIVKIAYPKQVLKSYLDDM